MGKQGPCYHCGISTTPLWRNGPPDKPVLCNACGSRWRTKGTLANYMPMHSGGCGVRSESADKSPRGKKGTQKPKEQRSHKRKEPCNSLANIEYGFQRPDFYPFRSLDEDASTRSSTGSGISYSEGCAQRMAGAGRISSVYRPLWDCPVPSKKRTPSRRHRPSSAKLAHLQSFFYEPEASALYSFEEDLLVEYKTPLMAAEIGLGGVFIRPPVSVLPEIESVSSSLLFESRGYGYSGSLKQDSLKTENLPVQYPRGVSKPLFFEGKEKIKQEPRAMEARYSDSPILRKGAMETFPYNNHDTLLSHQSPLAFLELKDITNFDIFMGHLTEQEQSQLMKLISSADVSSTPESLKDMFSSSQFGSALANFQLLLSKGIFNCSESAVSPCELQLHQQLLTVTDLTTSGWMERWSKFVNHSKCRDICDLGKDCHSKDLPKERLKERNMVGVVLPSTSPEKRTLKNLPSRPFGHIMAGESENSNFGSDSYPAQTSASPPSMASEDCQSNKLTSKGSSSRESVGIGKSGSCFSANSFYPTASKKGFSDQYNSMVALVNDLAEPDLLLDVPSSMSFQQAELLPQSVWSKTQPVKDLRPDCNSKLTDSLITTNVWQAEENLDWGGLFWSSPLSTGSGHSLPNGAVLNTGKLSL